MKKWFAKHSHQIVVAVILVACAGCYGFFYDRCETRLYAHDGCWITGGRLGDATFEVYPDHDGLLYLPRGTYHFAGDFRWRDGAGKQKSEHYERSVDLNHGEAYLYFNCDPPAVRGSDWGERLVSTQFNPSRALLPPDARHN